MIRDKEIPGEFVNQAILDGVRRQLAAYKEIANDAIAERRNAVKFDTLPPMKLTNHKCSEGGCFELEAETPIVGREGLQAPDRIPRLTVRERRPIDLGERRRTDAANLRLRIMREKFFAGERVIAWP